MKIRKCNTHGCATKDLNAPEYERLSWLDDLSTMIKGFGGCNYHEVGLR